jgi:hypothetical protein
MKKNKKIIKFLAINEHTWQVKEKPKPASSFIPEWWQKMSPLFSNEKFDLNPGSNVTAKKCFPLLDSITAGYIVPLWTDVMVKKDIDGTPLAKWAVKEPVFDVWPYVQSKGFEIPNGFNRLVFKYLHDWIIETPKGYSCLITHPFGYPNTPFRTLTGIVDTDTLKTGVSAPFVIQDGFEGIIEKGTPMFQIIPFKRDEWKSEIGKKNPNEVYYDNERLMTKIVSSYGRFLRSKKEYN